MIDDINTLFPEEFKGELIKMGSGVNCIIQSKYPSIQCDRSESEKRFFICVHFKRILE